VVAGAERLTRVETDDELIRPRFVFDPGGDDEDAPAEIDDAEELAPGDGPVLLVERLRDELHLGERFHGAAKVLGEDGAELARREVHAEEDGLVGAHAEALFGAEDIDRFLDGDTAGGDIAHHGGHGIDEGGGHMSGDFEPEHGPMEPRVGVSSQFPVPGSQGIGPVREFSPCGEDSSPGVGPLGTGNRALAT